MKLDVRLMFICGAAACALIAAPAVLAQDAAAPAATTQTTTTDATAAPAPAPAAATTDASVTAAPAQPEQSGPVGAPPAGKGQIVFFRPSRMVGMALTFTVRENDSDLGRLPNAHYFVQVADPGIHEYQIGRNDTLRIEIEAGQTYYAQNNIAMGIMAGRAVLAPTDQAAFEHALPHMHVSEPLH